MSSPRDVPRSIRVEVIIPASASSFSGARLIARLDDVTMLDVPARMLSCFEAQDICHRQGSATRVSLELPLPETNAKLAVNVHIARGSDDAFHRGDLINVQSYPVHSNEMSRIEVVVRDI